MEQCHRPTCKQLIHEFFKLRVWQIYHTCPNWSFKGTVSRDEIRIWWHIYCIVSSRPKLGTGTFFKFFSCSNDFTEKVYFPRLMRVYDGLTMFSACTYLVQVSLLLIGQQGLGDFFRYRTLLIDWEIVPIYANAIGKQPRQRQLLLVQDRVWSGTQHPRDAFPRDAISKKIRSGTHRSGTTWHCTNS